MLPADFKKTGIEDFLELAGQLPVADVRSPSEFKNGHIPGAVNIPLFSDRGREIVGTMYKNEGRQAAITEGLKLSGPSMHEKLREAVSIARDGRILVHCWRGGMRSEAMAWLFSLGDLDARVLDGGYKAYRHFLLEKLSVKRKTIVLGGMTGSSKTHILSYLRKHGQQVIDLERIACHKGSAFGSLGQPDQPSTEHFSNLLYSEWKNLRYDEPVWLEDESRNIGTVFLHDAFYSNMQEMPAIILMMDVKTRMPRLLEEYSCFPKEVLKASVLRISKRLGGDNTRDALEAIESGNYARAIEITLNYYDRAYMYGLNRKKEGNIIMVDTSTDDIETNAMKVLEAAQGISWAKAGFTDV